MYKTFCAILCLLTWNCISQQDVNANKLLLKKSFSEKEKVELSVKIANHYLRNDRNTDSAFVYITNVEEIAKQNNDSTLYARVFQLSSKAYYLDSDYTLTEQLGKKAINLFTKSDDFEEAAMVKRTLGNMNQILFKNKEAINYFREAEPYLKGKEKVLLYIGLATVNRQINDLDKSIFYYNQAFELSNNTNDETHLYDIYNGLATVYNANNDSDKALSSMDKALKEATKTNDYLAQVVCYHNIGYLQKGLENYAMAKENFESAIALFDNMSNKFMKASTYMYYSETLLLQKDIEGAKENLALSERIYQQIGNTGRIPTILNIRARIEQAQGNFSKSIELLRQAITLSETNEITGITQNNYLRLSEVYELSNRPVDALKAYKKYETIKDSISQLKKVKEIETQKIKFDLAALEREAEAQNQELILLDEKQKASTYRNVLLGFFCLGLLFFIYRQRSINKVNRQALEAENELSVLKQKQLNLEMKYKNNEITDFALQINERNKLLNTFNDRIRDIKKDTTTATKKQLSELQLFINNNIEVNKEKVTLNTKVRETEESFVYKLKEKCPKLSPKEVKVATYLRLNLASKQIASQMGIAEQSVNNYRGSIRKKFQLKNDVNIIDFLKSI